MNFKKLLIPFYRNSIKISNRIKYGQPIVVTMYHRINNYSDKELERLSVSPELFRDQLLYFKKHYTIIDINNIPDKLSKPGVIITFDDGYADNLYNALPILEELGIPAIVFPATININTKHEFWWEHLTRAFKLIGNQIKLPNSDKVLINNRDTFNKLSKILKKKPHDEIMSWIKSFESENNLKSENREVFRSLTNEELIHLASSPLVTIGLHTHNHYDLSNLSYNDQVNEIDSSIKTISNFTKKPITQFAFPFGAFNNDTLKICSNLNLKGYLANNRISNLHNLTNGPVNRILIPNIAANEMPAYINQFI